MALGRRGRRHRNKLDATMPGQQPREHAQEATSGPFDAADAPEDDVERLDLGALRVPVIDGCQLQVELSPDGQVVAATLTSDDGQMQVGVFAAPRTAGIWDSVRRELLAEISAQGGTGQEQDGPWGRELLARVRAQGGHQMARFVGVDGPRWFLRALMSGPAATDAARAEAYEAALRQVVVVRGPDPLPVREPLVLALPRDVADQIEAGDAAEQPPA